VRDLVGRRIDTFRSEELEKLRREQRIEADRAVKLADDLAEKLAALQVQTAAQISALQVKAGVGGRSPVSSRACWSCCGRRSSTETGGRPPPRGALVVMGQWD
jgi:hypothetical protein